MRLRPVHVSFLDEPRNPLSNRHSSFHVILVSSIRYYLLVDENSQAQVRDGLYSVRPRTLKFLTARCLWPRTWAERVSRLRSRTGRFPLVLLIPKPEPFIQSTGHIPDSRLKYFIRLVAIGFAYTGENGARGDARHRRVEPDWISDEGRSEEAGRRMSFN